MKRVLPLLLALAAGTGDVRAANWSHWRGPQQNGVSTDTGLPAKWSPNPKAADNNLLWKAPYGGITTPIVQNGRVYLINSFTQGKTEQERNLHQQERVCCFDVDSGKLLWEHKFNVWLTDIVADRLGWTFMTGDPETGNVYAHGTQGLLFCFDKDGKILWQKSLHEEFGRISGYGGRVTSPIIDGDLLLLGLINSSWGHQAIGRNRFVAFDKRTGNVVWWSSTGHPVKDTYYSVPIVAEINGQRLLISGGGDGGVHAFKVRTGEKVWSYLFGTGAVNCSPVVDGNFVFIGHGEENEGASTQGRVICLDAGHVEKGEPKLVWKVDGIKAKFASPIIHQGRLFIPDEIGRLYCLDAKDGKEHWHYDYGRNTKGSPVLADGKIYVGEVDSRFHILKPGDSSCEELSNVFFRKAKDAPTPEINGSAAIYNGRVYFMTTTDLYCLATKDGKAGPVPPAAKDAPAAKSAKLAHLQIYPADVTLHPGESVDLKARTYDDHGHLIGEAAVEWSLAGMRPPEGLPPPAAGAKPAPPAPALQGELSARSGASTKLTVAKAPPGQFGRVVCKLGELTGEARIRVAPVLPLTADFSKVPEGRTPGGWVSTQGKFAVVDKDGKKMLKKLAVNPSPLVARANAFMGMPNLTDYTIEADLMGTKVGDDLPDMGIVANRYHLMLWGNTQQLRLVSWDALPRVDKTIAWPWKPNVWYHLKLTVEQDGGKATVRGKVWQGSQPEPKDWTVEFVDPVPNKEGSPALYGYAAGILENRPGTDIFYDNVKVTPNKKTSASSRKETK
jgi:outer membrane protein assembly factor BamB